MRLRLFFVPVQFGQAFIGCREENQHNLSSNRLPLLYLLLTQVLLGRGMFRPLVTGTHVSAIFIIAIRRKRVNYYFFKESGERVGTVVYWWTVEGGMVWIQQWLY